SDVDIIRLVLENSNVPFVCNDETKFLMGTFDAIYVNVDEAGFRWNDTRPVWPPDDDAFNIFLFGGSTTFGFGEADNNTIATFLQRDLQQYANVVVYNFGQHVFFSGQERSLLEQLLEDDFVPNAAIFIDGLNDFYIWDG